MNALPIVDAASPNHGAREGGRIDLIVLHYTGMASGAAALRRLTDPSPTVGAYRDVVPVNSFGDEPDDAALGRVSAHYLVETDGRVLRLVDEARAAWHAGVASWGGAGDINDRSIGVEIVNGGHDYPDAHGAPPAYPDVQTAAVLGLVRDVAGRHAVAPWRVVGHSDVAPDRKMDPGEHFPWSELDDAGLALGPRGVSRTGRVVLRLGAAGEEVRVLQRRLAALGYGVVATGGYDARTADVVAAFQRRFRSPSDDRIDGARWSQSDADALDAAFIRCAALARKGEAAGAPWARGVPVDPGMRPGAM